MYMKATGIVRRIDDLGRVVIPKEIRRTMRIREGDPLEIYTDREGEVIFKKYSPIGELMDFAAEYAETLYKTCNMPVAVCDRDCIIACAGVPKKEFLEKKNSAALEKIIEGRSLYTDEKAAEKVHLTEESESCHISCAMPIFTEGDVIGCVMSLAGESAKGERLGYETEAKLIQTAASFLGRQLEA
ncbi:MAG: AbrB/MazE/SpoVT family DNA-binding domain-containing protein [Clostridia bacterium]|nr:AbrB/MazE/SpoVT family DNA-binding domain-containing protein [Clostridia bacterium]